MKNPMRTFVPAGVLLVAVLLPVGSMAQSLADVARKEEERRKAIKGSGKVYTNDDLVRTREGSAPPASDATSAPAGGAANATPNAATEKPGEKPAVTDETKTEPYWKKRMTTAQEQLNRNKVLQVALEGRVNGLNAEIVNMDNPYQRTVLQENLKTAMIELERVKRDIVAGTKAVADIQEEARKANIPPGWLR